MPTARTPRREKRSYALSRIRWRATDSTMGSARGSALMAATLAGTDRSASPRCSGFAQHPARLQGCRDERRDPVLPRLKRLRPPGRESRGRAHATRIRRLHPAGTLEPVRRPERRGPRLLQGSGTPLPGGRRGARALASLMLLALVAGCGEGGLSHSDYVKRADAICAAYADATKPNVRPRSYTEIVAYVRKTLPLYEAALLKLKALRPPSSDAATAHRWLAADRRVAKAVRSLGEAAER